MTAHQPFEGLTPLKPLMDACVHCGFCLTTCPSYVLLGTETDSPRGRIHLMRAGMQGRLALDAGVVSRFDTCLGCMACETACPSGVRYAPLIEETRATIEANHRRPLGDRLFRRLLFAVLPFPWRLRIVAASMGIARRLGRHPHLLARLPRALANLATLASGMPRPSVAGPVQVETPAVGIARLRVGLVTGCVQSVFFGDVNQASARVLAAEGCDVVAPRGQGCCGALALHAGRSEDARAFARGLIAAFDATDVDQIVINAAGCGSTMKTYGELLKDDPAWAERARRFSARVRDITETLAGLTPARAVRHPVPARVAYHDACHLAHAQGIRAEPRALLASIPGVTVVPLAENDLCCGSAGIFNLVQPEMAATLGRRKAGRIAEAGVDLVVTSNPGCIVQIGAATRAAGGGTRVVHLVELLDAAIRGTGLPAAEP